MFADTPWIVAPHNWLQHLPPLYSEIWPEERRLGRLHAMGYDAYQLIAALYTAGNGLMSTIDGATGQLYLDADGCIRRNLAWAQFQGGSPVAMPDPESEVSPDMDVVDEVTPHTPEDADDGPWFEVVREL